MNRWATSILDISSVKTATGMSWCIARFAATPSANADLPMLGRPATMTRFPGWRPDVIESTSRKPVGVPVISPPDSYIFVICSKVSRTSTSTWSKLPRIRCCARSNTICSAWSTSSGVSPGRSQPSRWICSPTSVSPRSVAISRTIFA